MEDLKLWPTTVVMMVRKDGKTVYSLWFMVCGYAGATVITSAVCFTY
jgi:hypothetical protein